jgi:phosphoribosylformylglycinamidine synthase
MLGKPYGIVQSHGMNPILNRHDPYEGTVWAIAEAAANYVAAGGNIHEASAVGNYIWPFPDELSMGDLDRSVDAAVDMMHELDLPVISGKDSLSSTYRGQDGEVIKIPPVYAMSIFGRIPDVEKTMTTDIKKPGSTLILVGQLSDGMGGSAYYDVAGGSSGDIPTVDKKLLPKVLDGVQSAIANGQVLACHDVSEGGVISALAEMCFGGDAGAEVWVPYRDGRRDDDFLFNETAGTFVVEVESEANWSEIFRDLPYRVIGHTTRDRNIKVNNSRFGNHEHIFTAGLDELKQAWQDPMQELFHG